MSYHEQATMCDFKGQSMMRLVNFFPVKEFNLECSFCRKYCAYETTKTKVATMNLIKFFFQCQENKEKLKHLI